LKGFPDTGTIPSNSSRGNIMPAEKLSISLQPETVRFIEEYRAAHAIRNRSQVVELALRKLRERELEAAYLEAAVEADPDSEGTLDDGLSNDEW
jgi:antitoxin MazE9